MELCVQRATHNGAALKDVREQQRCARQLVGGWLEIISCCKICRSARARLLACLASTHTDPCVSLVFGMRIHSKNRLCVLVRTSPNTLREYPRKGLDNSESLSTQAGTDLGLLTSDYTIYIQVHMHCAAFTHTLKIDCVHTRERVLPKGVPMRRGLDSSEGLSTHHAGTVWAS